MIIKICHKARSSNKRSTQSTAVPRAATESAAIMTWRRLARSTMGPAKGEIRILGTRVHNKISA